MMRVEDWCAMDRSTLMTRLQHGHPIDIEALPDADYLGISLGIPSWVERLTWKTFVKAFRRDPHSGAVVGYNQRMEQRGLYGPHRPLLRRGAPVQFGHFGVRSLQSSEQDLGIRAGAVIDYSLAEHGRLDPTHRLRDPIVAVYADSMEWLLGWSYVMVRGRAIKTPSFFLLQRQSERF